MHLVLGSRSERGGARRAPTKRVTLKIKVLLWPIVKPIVWVWWRLYYNSTESEKGTALIKNINLHAGKCERSLSCWCQPCHHPMTPRGPCPDQASDCRSLSCWRSCSSIHGTGMYFSQIGSLPCTTKVINKGRESCKIIETENLLLQMEIFKDTRGFLLYAWNENRSLRLWHF